MAKYKAYPEYRDSGVEWLKAIPEHWKISKLRYQFVFDKGLTITKEHLQDEGIPCVNYGEVHSKYGFEVDPEIHTLKCVSDKYLKDNSSSLLAKGDIVFADTSEDIDGSGNFTQLVTDTVTFAGYHTIIARPFERENSRFYAYLLDCKELRSQVRHAVKGVKVFSITQAILRNLSIWLPSKDEQAKIAAFLDHETAKIDKLIEKQQQLIEFLKEKRQAVISHAVTKGLNPDVPMKDSGVEWLGEVPEHWKLIKFSHCVSIRSGQVDPRKFPYCDYWLIAPNHIVSGEGRIINLETAKDQGADSGKYLCRTGEVIYSKIRPALVKACLSPSDTVLCSADMYPMTSYNGLTNNFLLLYLLSDVFTRFAVNQADRVAMPKINRESLSDCKIPVPPIDEQEKICSHAREALEKLDVLLQKSQLTIEIFQERRTALISAAVTGKIDVRDWVAPDTQDIEASQEATA
ncbi:restriction endonuclease subunit S [Klebsiella variicola]|uniref:restriction endonuclease subunit S n=1 Tax=Klebsiella variicola TaxID=244366 RepID=UPI002B05E104|nr:restriction endonuclease subunit S [Klebsiella variicola]